MVSGQPTRFLPFVASSAVRLTVGATLAALPLTACVQTQWQQGQSTQTLRSADQTMDLEQTDRVGRVQRLSHLDGVAPPRIEQAVVQPGDVAGIARPIPVIRLTFDERDFFAAGSAVPQAGAARVLRVVAENMRRDVPDVRVTVLGHTDATGTEAGNQALSRQRALAMVQELVASGVNPGQLSAIAIGDAQPIAPNSSEAGRARNRRVEFLVSPSEQANLSLVSGRPIDPAFLAVGGAGPRSARRQVAVSRPAYSGASYSGPADFSEAPDAGHGSRLALADTGTMLTVGEDSSGSPVDGRSSARPATSVAETGSPVSSATAEFTPAQP